MAVRRRVTPKAETELIKSDDPEENNSDAVAESVESILALLRGLAPTLVGSAPNAAEIQKLVDDLKNPK